MASTTLGFSSLDDITIAGTALDEVQVEGTTVWMRERLPEGMTVQSGGIISAVVGSRWGNVIASSRQTSYADMTMLPRNHVLSRGEYRNADGRFRDIFGKWLGGTVDDSEHVSGMWYAASGPTPERTVKRIVVIPATVMPPWTDDSPYWSYPVTVEAPAYRKHEGIDANPVFVWQQGFGWEMFVHLNKHGAALPFSYADIYSVYCSSEQTVTGAALAYTS